MESWAEQAPKGFRFAWKASKFITHWKLLSAKSENSLALLEGRVKLLGKKAGPILFQLPARFTKDQERIASFLKLLPRRRRYAFEFRHESWYDEEIYALLRKRNIALCISDHADAPSPWEVTADFVYLRAHGPGGRYKGHYSETTLNEWAKRIRKRAKSGRDVYVYFDNDQKSAAPADAKRLMDLLRPQAVIPTAGTLRNADKPKM